MRIKINKNFSRYRIGQTLCIPDDNGVPKDIFWRRRLKDSKIDECCSVVIEEKNKSNKKDSLTSDRGVK